ncbi:hypothetical protein LRS13_21035 [Svornostia abyssi]|uniref:Universal stress protein n=1 Tax=Svornostia abyssi TaxID=2898438 RepID=A0ABY5PEM6_9ACTN|nr:hypothetical protein LRS13_21035 [Parviterribacteraceae bacterium J379]
MPNVLVIANETVGGSALLEAALSRHKADPSTHFHLVVPQTRPRSGLVIYDDAVRHGAQVRVDLATTVMQGHGIDITGDVGDGDPYNAAMDALRDAKYDEVIVSTLPIGESRWLGRDLIQRFEEEAGVPVTHVVTDLKAEGLPFHITLVVANRTASDDKLIARMKEKAADNEQQLFIVVIPQEGGQGHHAGAARARLGNALDRMRGEGLTVAGMIGDPDPYDATMNALQFFNVNDVLISTLPEERSGWLRQQLLPRVRKASNIDVEHIIAERTASTEAA